LLRIRRDPTEITEAYSVAQYLLHIRRYSLKRALELVARPGAERILGKLFDNQSEFLNAEGRAVGIDCVAFMTASKLQQSLDVKHTRAKNATTTEATTSKRVDSFDDDHPTPYYRPIDRDNLLTPSISRSLPDDDLSRCCDRVSATRYVNIITADHDGSSTRNANDGYDIVTKNSASSDSTYVTVNGADTTTTSQRHSSVADTITRLTSDNESNDAWNSGETHVKRPVTRQMSTERSAYTNGRVNLRDIREPLKPHIKIDLLHTDARAVWIRFHAPRGDFHLPNRVRIRGRLASAQKRYGRYLAEAKPINNISREAWLELNFDYALVRVCRRVYEVYLENHPHMTPHAVHRLIRYIDKKRLGSVIFCSELRLFQYNRLLFVSNYLKFSYCYGAPSHIFDPRDFDEIRLTIMYLMYAMLFLDTNNLTNMPIKSHGPMIAYNGQRPRAALAKFDPTRVHRGEGTRAMLAAGKGADMGTVSNYLEVVTCIRLSDIKLHNML